VDNRVSRHAASQHSLLRSQSLRLLLAVLALIASACNGDQTTIGDDADASPTPESAVAPADPDQRAEADDTTPGTTPSPEPVPYIPAGSPGSAQSYAELIVDLESEVPAELRGQVPWPDLRNPNPIVAQQEIFELWIWMAATYPNPDLVAVMTAPGSPSREEVVSVFGKIDGSGNLETRTGAPYVAFDHVVVTFASAGLPLWLSRDVPEDAVVVYYSDQSGPTTITNRETGEIIEVRPQVGTRAWLSIMVPTDVGWQLWRDQLIEPNDPELQTPDVPPPPAETDDRPSPAV